MKQLLTIALFILLLVDSTVAQQPDSSRQNVREDIERALENIDPEDTELNTEQLIQFLQDLAANPVNINKAEVDRLLQIPGLNLKKSKAIINYREKEKPFESVEELVEVPGIGSVTLERIRPYVTIGMGRELGLLYTDPKYWMGEGNVEFLSRFKTKLQKGEGYLRQDSSGYLGSPVKYYHRLRYWSNHISANLTQEKDAGEPMYGKVGFDYTSWHVALTDNGLLEKLVVGDFSLSFGQGLVLWNGGLFGKGREVISSVAKQGRGIKPYTSSRETNYYRGLAATYGGKVQFTGFYSAQSRSASVINGDTTRFPSSSGLHRTLTEIDKKDNVNQRMYGGRVRAELPFGFVGVTGYHTSFNKFISTGQALYNKYNFRGSDTYTIGLDYKFLIGPTLQFGEVSRSENGGYGFITGAESPISDRTELVIAYRKYGKDFHSVYGSGFGELSGEPQNEEGFYVGVRHELNSKIWVSTYFDQFRFPSPRFGTHQATKGYEWLGLVEVNFNEDLEFYLQGRSEIKEVEYEIQDHFGRQQRRLGNRYRSGLRGHLAYRVNSRIRLRTRAEVVRFVDEETSPELGYLIYQDLRFEPNTRWTVDARVTMFESESYDSRVYQFENDLLYLFSNTVLYDQGQRLYLLVNYEPFDFFEIWAKFGITVFENRQLIGSGLNEIEGNKRSDLGIQIRIVF